MSAPHRPRRRTTPASPPLLRPLGVPLGVLLGVLCAVLGSALPAAATGMAPVTAGARSVWTVAGDHPGATLVPAGAAGPTAGAALGGRRTPTPTPDDGDGGGQAEAGVVDVAVTSITPQLLRPADELVVRARVRNDTGDTLDAPRATLRLNRSLLATRSSLQQWVDQPVDGTVGTPVQPVDLPGPLEPGAAVDVELRVAASALDLGTGDATWGPRGLSVELTDDGDRRAVGRTFVLWWPTEQAVTPTLLSVLVPLTGGPVDPTAVPSDPADDLADDDARATTGTGTASPSGTRAPAPTTSTPAGPRSTPDGDPEPSPAPSGVPTDGTLDRLADAVAATAGHPGITWAVDPALVVAARAAGDDDPAARWAQTATAAAVGREVVALPALDPDLAALAHAAEDDLTAEAWARARASTDPLLGPSPRADLVLPATDVPDLATAGLGARHGATTVVVGADALTPERLTYTPTGRAGLTTATGDVAAVLADDVLSAQLRSPDGTSAATAVQRVLAETAVIARERPSEQRHLLATTGRGWDPEPAVARAQLGALDAAPWVRLSPLSILVATPDPGLDRPTLPVEQVTEAEIDPGQVAAMVTARAELAAFATIVPDPARLLAGADDAVLATTAVAWRAEPVQRAMVVDAVVTELAARRTGVTVVPGSELNLISETGRFPLGLRNDLDQDVTVQVVVDPASPVLVIDERQTVTIPARSETQVRVPFHAVGSGDVQVAVALLSPDGVPLGPAERLTVRVRADWENVGTAVVAGLLGVALVVGIVRTIRRGQTRTRGAGATPVAEIARHPEDPS